MSEQLDDEQENRPAEPAEDPDGTAHAAGGTQYTTVARMVERESTAELGEQYLQRVAQLHERQGPVVDWPLEAAALRDREPVAAEHDREEGTTTALDRRWFESDPNASISVTSLDGRQEVALTVDADAVELAPPSMATEPLEGDIDDGGELVGDGTRHAHLDLAYVPREYTEAKRRRAVLASDAIGPTKSIDEVDAEAGGGNGARIADEPTTAAGADFDEPTAVFGADDRTAFRDRSFPWCTVGRVETAGGYCTGTMIGERLLLTATHCIDWTGSGPGWLKFTPAAYDGTAPFGEAWAKRVLYWHSAPGSTLTDTETAFDYAVCVLDRDLGSATGYVGYRTYSWWWNGGDYWQHVGYPGAIANGRRPVFVDDVEIHSAGPRFMDGRIGYVMGTFMDTSDGQSGGPVVGLVG